MEKEIESKKSTRPIKVNGYNNAKKRAKQIKKEYAADDRQAKYSALSKEKKIALIKSRRGESKKELARVLASK